MPLPAFDGSYTAEDYWALPEGRRAELIDGELYDMAPSSLTHQTIVLKMSRLFDEYVERRSGGCRVLPAPFAVNLFGDESTYVEPDLSVVCDADKLTERCCQGAPDLVVGVVSPSSRRMDYLTKADRYARAGVCEYWIVDPTTSRTAVYRYDRGDVTPTFYPFGEPVPVGIRDGLEIVVADLLK